jgi:hypothetical protein
MVFKQILYNHVLNFASPLKVGQAFRFATGLPGTGLFFLFIAGIKPHQLIYYTLVAADVFEKFGLAQLQLIIN